MTTSSTALDDATATPRWVVGSDGSEHAFDALSWAAHQARGRNAAIELVAAFQSALPPAVPLIGDVSAALDITSSELATAELERTAARAAESFGVEVSTHKGEGTAAHVLLEASKNADLLIVGHRGRGGFARLLLGSVSHQVACHATCPTVIVPGPAQSDRLDRVVIGVDGSVNSMDALRWALRFVPSTAEVLAISTWETPYVGAIGVDYAILSDIRSANEQAIATAVADLERELGCPGRTKVVFATGHPGSEIVERSADADLVVVGARGRSGIVAALLGSTATWVAHHPPCPTVIVAPRGNPRSGRGEVGQCSEM